MRAELLATTALMLAFATDNEATEETAFDAFTRMMRARQGVRVGWERFCAKIGANPDAVSAPFTKNTGDAMRMAEGTAAGDDAMSCVRLSRLHSPTRDPRFPMH